jgi:hypothetical protein
MAPMPPAASVDLRSPSGCVNSWTLLSGFVLLEAWLMRRAP